jgi:subfamily B ATP-binding cassette protein MsbA
MTEQAHKHSDEAKGLGDAAAVYRRLLGYGLPYWKIFMVSIVAMVIYASLGPKTASLMQPLIDGSFASRDPEAIRQVALALLVLFLARGVASFVGDYFSGWTGRRIVADVRRDLFDQLLNLPSGFYDNASSGQLLAKLLYNSEQVANALIKGIVTAVRDGLTIVGLVLWMVYQSVLLSLVFLFIGPILGLSIRYVSKRFRRISLRIQESMGSVSHIAQEVIDAQRIVKVFNGKDYEARKFARENERNFKRQMKMIATDAVSAPIIQFISISGFAAVIYAVSLESIRDTITLGTFISFIVAMAMLFTPIKRLTQINAVLQPGIAAGENIFELLDSERERDSGALELASVEGDIEYRRVGLRYAGRESDALTDICLRVPAGQTVALVGQSGSGKTSLVRLLPRLYEASAGEISIDGHDIRDFSLSNLRKHIAYVGQEVTLFNDSVASNIAYGCRGAVSQEAIETAARAAHALEFIERLPKGFATVVGQQGIVLSGGQRQRIAIARALLKNAPILILDEATSALDTESERSVQMALEVLMRDRTTLVIAHRLSTIQNADQIYVMREGRIVEHGTHAQLLAANAYYASLYRLQFGSGLYVPRPEGRTKSG